MENELTEKQNNVLQMNEKGEDFCIAGSEGTGKSFLPKDLFDYEIENGIVKRFEVFENLENVKDSMQFNSNTEIALLTLGNGKTASIEVGGEVMVEWNGERYSSPSEFPQELKNLIETDDRWEDDERVYIHNNNWFELFYNASDSCPEHCEVVDVERKSKKEIYELMVDTINKCESKTIVLPTYEEFLATTQKKQKNKEIER